MLLKLDAAIIIELSKTRVQQTAESSINLYKQSSSLFSDYHHEIYTNRKPSILSDMAIVIVYKLLLVVEAIKTSISHDKKFKLIQCHLLILGTEFPIFVTLVPNSSENM